MSMGRAVVIGFTATFFLVVLAGMAAFIFGADLTILGASARSVSGGGQRKTEVDFNVYPLLIGVVLSGLVWFIGNRGRGQLEDSR